MKVSPLRPHSFLVLGLALSLAGCSVPTTDEPDQNTAGTSTSEGTESGDAGADSSPTSLSIGVTTDIPNSDPQLESFGPTANLYYNVYDGLYTVDRQGAIVPHLVTDATESEDGLTRVLTIREDVTFHDGSALTAADVAFTFGKALDPDEAVPLASDLGNIASVEATGDYEVTFTLNSPDDIFENTLITPAALILPQEYYTEQGAEGFQEAPVGSGPFTVTGRQTGQSVSLERYDDYWGQVAQVDEIVLHVVADAATKVTMLESGQLDIATNLPPSQINRLKQVDSLDIRQAPSGELVWIPAQSTEPRFEDPRVLTALNHAIDREQIIEQLLFGSARPIAALQQAANPGYNADIEHYAYDLDLAQELLTEAGFDFDAPITVEVPIERWPGVEDALSVVQSDLGTIGVSLEIRAVPYAQWFDDFINDQLPELTVNNMSNRVYDSLPLMRTYMTCEGTYSLWCSPEHDAWVAEVEATPSAEREQAISDFMAKIHEHPMGIYLWENEAVMGLSGDVDYEVTPGSYLLLHLNHATKN